MDGPRDVYLPLRAMNLLPGGSLQDFSQGLISDHPVPPAVAQGDSHRHEPDLTRPKSREQADRPDAVVVQAEAQRLPHRGRVDASDATLYLKFPGPGVHAPATLAVIVSRLGACEVL